MKKQIKYLFEEIIQNKSNTYFIHYSCQSLSDENEGYSPRITSIAVLHFENSQTISFSTHLSAEELHIDRGKIREEYDEIEKDILNKFATFLEKHIDNTFWVHWNMKNVNYGFEAIEHRYKVLTSQTLPHIPEKNRFNLSALLKEKYGVNYAKDPRMLNLMLLNGDKDRHFLTGEEETTAYKASDFVKLHNSTMCKVSFFRNVFNKAMANKLCTANNRITYHINKLYQHPVIQIIGIIGTFGSLIGIILTIINWIQGVR